MKRVKFNLGDIYRIEFLDHSIGSRGLVLCKVVGWCVEVDNEKVVLRYWDTVEESFDDENTEHITIAKGTIRDVRRVSSH